MDKFYISLVDYFKSSIDLQYHSFTKGKIYEIDTNEDVGIYFVSDDHDRLIALIEKEFNMYFMSKSEYRNIKIDDIIDNESR